MGKIHKLVHLGHEDGRVLKVEPQSLAHTTALTNGYTEVEVEKPVVETPEGNADGSSGEIEDNSEGKSGDESDAKTAAEDGQVSKETDKIEKDGTEDETPFEPTREEMIAFLKTKDIKVAYNLGDPKLKVLYDKAKAE